MNIEEELFNKSKVNINKLLEYGFIKSGNILSYTKMIDNNFLIIININGNKVYGKIIDKDTNLEYTNYRIDNINGAFANKIKTQFVDLLIEIRDKCFDNQYFISSQANRIVDIVINKYDDLPEFLWKDLKDGVFRNKKNHKWYGIIMSVMRNKIDNGEDIIDVLNVKLNESEITDLLDKKGYYKAYHMNKKKWISIILDDTINDVDIIHHIMESYNLSESKK